MRGPSIGRLDRAEPLADPARTSNEGGGLMRTLRATLAGAVMLALLGGSRCSED